MDELANDLSGNPPSKGAPIFTHRDVRLATWHKFEVDGSRLPRRSSASRLLIPIWATGSYVIAQRILCFYLKYFVATSQIMRSRIEVAAFVLTFGGAPLVFWLSRKLSLRHIPESDSAVRMFLNVDNHPYGRDVGQLSFEEGWMVFEGERTSFSISPRDVRSISLLDHGAQLELDVAPAKITVGLITVTAGKANSFVLKQEIADWQRVAKSTAGITLLPPTSPAPNHNYLRLSPVPTLLAFVPSTAIMLGLAMMNWVDGWPCWVLGTLVSLAIWCAILRVNSRSRNKAFINLADTSKLLQPTIAEI